MFKFERRISTECSPGEARGKVIAYYEKLGYQSSPTGSEIVLKRGSLSGSIFSSLPQKWQSQVTVQILPSAMQSSDILVQVNARPLDQLVTQDMKNVFERELDGLVKQLNIQEFETKLPAITEMDVREKVKAENQLKSGAGAFYFIAGMSLVNSVLYLLGVRLNFLIGLGITQLIDGIASALAKDYGSQAGNIAKLVAIFLDVAIAGVFVVFGVFARKRAKWSFVIGTILYALDGLLFLWVKDVLSIVFHIFVLFWLINGLMAIDKLKQVEKTQMLTSQ